jgi:anti-sigma B factor antagonist
MSIKIKAGKGKGKRKHCNVSIAGTMTIYDAVADKRSLLEALDSADEIEINLSGVSEMDTSGVQLLAMAKREAIKTGKTLRLVAHSQASLDVLDRYNLGGFFGDPVVISSRERRARMNS